MSWLDNLRNRKPEEPINRLLFFSKQELTEQTYAVIRVTWYLQGKSVACQRKRLACMSKM